MPLKSVSNHAESSLSAWFNTWFKIEPLSLYPSVVQCNVFRAEPHTVKHLHWLVLLHVAGNCAEHWVWVSGCAVVNCKVSFRISLHSFFAPVDLAAVDDLVKNFTSSIYICGTNLIQWVRNTKSTLDLSFVTCVKSIESSTRDVRS